MIFKSSLYKPSLFAKIVSGAHGVVRIPGTALGAGLDDHTKHHPLHLEHGLPGHAWYEGQDPLAPPLLHGGKFTNREEVPEWNQELGQEISPCKTSQTREKKF